MNKGKTVIIAEKVKAFAIALIGVCFFGIGTTYFEERLVYRLPRILIPVLDLFGNVALAIAMLVLGAGLIYYGFTKWKKVSDKAALYWVIAIIGLCLASFLMHWSDSRDKEKAAGMMEEMNQERLEQIDEIRGLEKPDFKNADIDKHVADFDAMYKKYEENLKSGNQEAINESMEEYGEWTMRVAPIMEKLNNDEKVELAKYLAKLSIMWSDLTQQNN